MVFMMGNSQRAKPWNFSDAVWTATVLSHHTLPHPLTHIYSNLSCCYLLICVKF